MNPLAFKEDGDRSAPAVVLGHSLGSDWQVWDEVTENLQDQWRVIRWDLPGHGQSDFIEGRGSMQHLASLVLEGLSARGIGSFHVGGISLGGMVSLAMAQLAPHRIRSLAMLDSLASLPPPEQWKARATQVRATGMKPLLTGTMERWFTPQFTAGKYAHRYERTAASFLACNPEGYAYCCEVIGGTDLSEKLGGVAVPTLLLTGDEDAGATPDQVRELAARIPGAENKISVLKEARHMTCVEQPQLVAAELVGNICRAL